MWGRHSARSRDEKERGRRKRGKKGYLNLKVIRLFRSVNLGGKKNQNRGQATG